ncbi:MAG: Rid family detoxifying hydrolase [Bacteroidetes bacterium]|nr:Rid family detoxifying hydrolase [Bacteroidota bacterium]
MKYLIALALFLTFTGCQQSELAEIAPVETPKPEVEFLNSESALPDAPFSQAVRVGNMLYMSGQIGVMPGTREFPEGGFDEQAHQVMNNIKITAEQFGSSMDRVVKCLVMIEDMSRWADFNAVYVQYFPGPKPARSAFGSKGLALGALFEVECIATLP